MFDQTLKHKICNRHFKSIYKKMSFNIVNYVLKILDLKKPFQNLTKVFDKNISCQVFPLKHVFLLKSSKNSPHKKKPSRHCFFVILHTHGSNEADDSKKLYLNFYFYFNFFPLASKSVVKNIKKALKNVSKCFHSFFHLLDCVMC